VIIFLHLLGDDFQNELHHHLSRDGGEADWLVGPWVFLLALCEDWNDFGFPAVLGHFSCSPGLFKCGGQWLSICQLPQHLWVHPIGTIGFVDVQFAKMISNLILLDQGKVFLSSGFLSYLQGLGCMRVSLSSEDWSKGSIQ